MGYCGVHSAEFGPVWTGDLGRSGAAAPTALRHGAATRGVLGERAQIGLACAAGRVNVGGLDSWLALVEQPPRTDEAPETAGHSQDVPERFARALRRQGNRAEPRTPGVLGRACLSLRDLSCVSRRWRLPRLARQSPGRVCALGSHQPASDAHLQRRRQGGQRLVRPEGARASSRLARTGGFVGLRWASPGGPAKGPCPTEPDVATRSRESNVPTNTSTPR